MSTVDTALPSIPPDQGAISTESQVAPSPSTTSYSDDGSASFARPRTNVGQPLWTHRVSASFNAMADQIAAASQAIALIPPLPDTVNSQLQQQIDEILETQKRLEDELSDLRNKFQEITEGPEKFQKQLDEHIAEFKLEQKRLPARLFNSSVTISKLPIKPLVMANGKTPSQFPATRGEFEHLTRERYEFLLKSYGQTISGDVNAKREALRSFIGLPP